MPRFSRRLAFLSVLALLASGSWAAAAAPIVSATTCWGRYGPPQELGVDALFYGAASSSATSTWAVGYAGASTLVEHWDGCRWTRQLSADSDASTATSSTLSSVVALSPTNQWAVGNYADTDRGAVALVEHGNGSMWSQLIWASPSGYLESVDGVSSANVWAVGQIIAGGQQHTLVVHGNGDFWKRQTSPSPGTRANLNGVSALAANNVWASGWYVGSNGVSHTLIEHWNGATWHVVSSPNKGGAGINNLLSGIFMLSSTNGWAVGNFTNAQGRTQTLILHWNGSTWKISASPNPGGGNHSHDLHAVVATSTGNAWAVGTYDTASSSGVDLLEYWNGSTWAVQSVPALPGTTVSNLYGITATSATSAWAVGDARIAGQEKPFAVHCC